MACCETARQNEIWIHVGSTPILSNAEDRETSLFLNHAALIDPNGVIKATYDKIHLFDVFLEGPNSLQIGQLALITMRININLNNLALP